MMVVSFICMSCCLFCYDNSEIENLLGDFLQFDSRGHVTSSITYTDYYSIWWSEGEYKLEIQKITYNPDGSYYRLGTVYEGENDDLNGNLIYGEGELKEWEEWGSYGYSSNNYTLIFFPDNYKRYLNYSYDPPYFISDPYVHNFSDDYRRLNNVLFTEYSNARVFKKDGNNWINIYKYIDTGFEDLYTETYTITSDSIDYRDVNNDSRYYDEAHDSNIYSERIWSADILETFPDNARLKENTLVKFKGVYTSYKRRHWDYDNDELGAWVIDPYDYINDVFSQGFYCFGDFLIRDYNMINLSRGITDYNQLLNNLSELKPSQRDFTKN